MKRIIAFLLAMIMAFTPMVGLVEEIPSTPTDLDETPPIVEIVEQPDEEEQEIIQSAPAAEQEQEQEQEQ